MTQRFSNSGAALRRLCAAALSVGALGMGLDACNTTPKPIAALAPPPLCGDFNFPIYFEKGSDQLTAQAQQELTFAAGRVKGCKLGQIEVLGLADADGAAHRNLVLSRERATVVAKALAAAGLPTPTFDIEALGESGSVTPSGEPEPLRRRAEVVIHASTPTAKP
jgi:outer membrane protein OmpA-like peptidoglycan-associated protein